MADPKTIYIAGASAELDLCESWIQRARDAGFHIALDWTATIRKVGNANPRDASEEQRAGWAADDLSAAVSADIFWLLFPAKPTVGAWVELGAALVHVSSVDQVRVVSGDWRGSIFTSLAHERFDDHEAAFRWIRERGR